MRENEGVDVREVGLYGVIEAGGPARERLAAALGAARLQSILVRPGAGHALDAASARPLVELAQAIGAAALIANDAALARALRADGVHIDGAEMEPEALEAAYAEARSVLGERAIVGCDAGHLRHTGMVLAEAGADYVGFGLGPAGGRGSPEAHETRAELIEWWAEIMEAPCVALDVETAEDAGALADAGADFIAVPLPSGVSPADAADRVTAWARAAGERPEHWRRDER